VVDSLIFAPFCARNSVGIFRVCPQRLPWAFAGRFDGQTKPKDFVAITTTGGVKWSRLRSGTPPHDHRKGRS
jgi:hypothetical protein